MRREARAALGATAAAVVLVAVSGCSGGGESYWGARSAGAEADSGKNERATEVGEDGEPDAGGGGRNSEDPHLREMFDSALAEFAAAESLRLSGSLVDEGSRMELDIWLDSDGDCSADIAMEGEGAMTILKSADLVWVKADDLFWETAGLYELGEQLDGRYLHGSTWDPAMAGFTELCVLEELTGDLPVDEFDARIDERGRSDLDGVPVVDVEVTERDGETATMRIAVEAPHYLHEISAVEDGERQRMLFDHYNEPLEITPPGPEEIFLPGETSPV
ncbi:hypothetical protein [Streptomyces spiramenti]|uniref:Lipoprotein n=1 Tax=Streptomyces spiramenti TaxID=2720606 RepID=A0ABX1AMN0_9ACTN|nr:hypothetical protein [Streptomyces spiramenti]NJP68362.1 hypothetical protein [Streptomyces spiramenti]